MDQIRLPMCNNTQEDDYVYVFMSMWCIDLLSLHLMSVGAGVFWMSTYSFLCFYSENACRQSGTFLISVILEQCL